MSCLEAHMSATHRVDSFLTNMTQDITELKTSLQFSSDDFADLQPNMTRNVKYIEEDLRLPANQVYYLYNYSSRNCIRIDGIQGSPNEKTRKQQRQKRDILKNKMHLNDSQIKIKGPIESASPTRTAPIRG